MLLVFVSRYKINYLEDKILLIPNPLKSGHKSNLFHNIKMSLRHGIVFSWNWYNKYKTLLLFQKENIKNYSLYLRSLRKSRSEKLSV